MKEKIIKDILKQSEKFFQTQEGNDQIEATIETVNKLQKLCPFSIIYKYDREDFVGHVSVLPTTKDLMDEFINKKITERDLLKRSVPRRKYQAIYVVAAVIEKKYRKKGFATEMLVEAIERMPLEKDPVLFYWPFAKAGDMLARRVSMILKMPIYKRKR